MNLNKVFLLGRLTADPQLRTTPSGQAVANFGLATNRIWIDKENTKREEAEFHNIVVWGKQAEVAQRFLAKGGLVLIEGRIQTRSWDDRQGQRRKTTEIIAERIQLGPRPFGQQAAQQATPVPVKGPEVIPTIDLDAPAETGTGEAGTGEEIKAEDLPF